jgi:hypothetical protein
MTIRPVRLLLLTLAFSLQALASKLPTVFDGYITNMVSPTEFDVGSRHITCDGKTTYELEVMDQNFHHQDDLTLQVGSHIHVVNAFEGKPRSFIATTIQAYHFPGSGTKNALAMEGIGLIQETPALHRDGQSWIGTLWVDGYPLQLTEKTKLTDGEGKPYPGDKIATNIWASYKATRNLDHSIHADSISFTPNQVDAEEKKFRDKSEAQIDEPDYVKKIPGKIKFHWAWSLDILPDKNVQDYVNRVGKSLIPQYQKDLPDSDPTKINFRFYVIQRPSKWKESFTDAFSCSNGIMDDVVSCSNGIMIVSDNVLASLDNEAQLAALLSNAIAATLDKTLYVHRTRLKTQNNLGWVGMATITGYAGAPLVIGDAIATRNLMLDINKQASRIGLRSMLQNGYDIREDPFAWTVAANQQVRNPLDTGRAACSAGSQSDERSAPRLPCNTLFHAENQPRCLPANAGFPPRSLAKAAQAEKHFQPMNIP